MAFVDASPYENVLQYIDHNANVITYKLLLIVADDSKAVTPNIPTSEYPKAGKIVTPTKHAVCGFCSDKKGVNVPINVFKFGGIAFGRLAIDNVDERSVDRQIRSTTSVCGEKSLLLKFSDVQLLLLFLLLSTILLVSSFEFDAESSSLQTYDVLISRDYSCCVILKSLPIQYTEMIRDLKYMKNRSYGNCNY